MNIKYDPEKLELVRAWIKIVESKRQTIRNVIGYAKRVYDATEAMGTWDEIKREFDSAKEKLMKTLDLEARRKDLNSVESEKLKNERDKKIKTLASIPKNKYWELRAKVVLKIKENPNMKYMLHNFKPDSGFGKEMVDHEICKAFKNET